MLVGFRPEVHEQCSGAELDHLAFIDTDALNEGRTLPALAIIVAVEGKTLERLELPARGHEPARPRLDHPSRTDHADPPLRVREITRDPGEVDRLRPGQSVIVAGTRQLLGIISPGAASS